MRALIFVAALIASVGSGCHQRGGARTDAGVHEDFDEGADQGTPVQGRRAFDVVARLTGQTDGGPTNGMVPDMNSFTLVLDTDARWVLGGANGMSGFAAVTTTDGRSFHSSSGFQVGTSHTCTGVIGLRYDKLDLVVDSTSLTGRATGAAVNGCGDCQWDVPFIAELTGTPDVTAPALLGSETSVADPFSEFAVVASEPLPATATARLVDASGHTTSLMPRMAYNELTSPVPGDVPVIVGFMKPDIVLQPGTSYAVNADGIADFSGIAGSDVPLRIGSFPPAPLVAEDGFESAPDGTLGGALIVTTGPVLPITGTRSLYVGSGVAPAVNGVLAGSSLLIRLTLQPGDTTLRFAYRTVTESMSAGGDIVNIGSVGGKIARATTSVGALKPITSPSEIFYADDIQTMTIPLPEDAAGELVVSISNASFSCGLERPRGGLLIDDLRVE